MYPITTKMNGILFAFPDALKVPIPAPPGFIVVPLPNFGQCPMATQFSTKVKALNMPVLHKNSEIPKTQGGEVGVQKGVSVPMQLEKALYTLGSLIVKVQGVPVVTLLKKSTANGVAANAPNGMQIAPSQMVVFAGG